MFDGIGHLDTQYYESDDCRIIHDDCLNALRVLEDNSVDLYIADPPYWKVVGEKWDYQWKTEDQYIAWCIPWLKEIYRTVRYGGTFYLFGYFRTLALLVPFLRAYGHGGTLARETGGPS